MLKIADSCNLLFLFCCLSELPWLNLHSVYWQYRCPYRDSSRQYSRPYTSTTSWWTSGKSDYTFSVDDRDKTLFPADIFQQAQSSFQHCFDVESTLICWKIIKFKVDLTLKNRNKKILTTPLLCLNFDVDLLWKLSANSRLNQPISQETILCQVSYYVGDHWKVALLFI